MTEEKLEELLYRLLCKTSVRELAIRMGYSGAVELTERIRSGEIGTDEVMQLIDLAGLNEDPRTRDWIFFNGPK